MVTRLPITPGAMLSAELDARRWTQKDLSRVLGRPEQAISEIVRGKKRVTAETALELEAALDVDAIVWLAVDAEHRLTLARGEWAGGAAIKRRAKRQRVLRERVRVHAAAIARAKERA